MASRRAQVTIPSDELLVEGEERNAGVTWPLAVDRWLDQRLAQARVAGEATTRKELVAALMTAAAPSDEDLSRILRAYRTKRVRDLFELTDLEAEITYLRPGPGPRKRRTS